MKKLLKVILFIVSIVSLSAAVACIISDYMIKKHSVDVDLGEDD